MAYNLRSRSIAETLRNEEDNDEILGASDSESEDNVSEQAEESDEYRVSDDGSDEDGDDDMAMDWENASLMQRLLGSAARGRPRTQLKGKDGFVWNTNLAQRQSGSGKSKKRKPNETSTRTRHNNNNNNFTNTKEDLENKKTSRRRNVSRSSNKKKVLEEANNSKLREVEVRVEDCLQSASALSALCRRDLSDDSSVSGEQCREETQTAEDSTLTEEASKLEEAAKVELEEETSKSSNEVSEDVKQEDTSTNSYSVEEEVTEADAGEIEDEESSTGSNSVQLVDIVQVTTKNSNLEIENLENSILENNDSNASDPMHVSEASAVICSEVISEEDDCVIVTGGSDKIEEVKIQQHHKDTTQCSLRVNDEAGSSVLSSSLYGGTSRMDVGEAHIGVNSLLHLHQLRSIPDDRSDSGVSSLRSGSGDERSGSRSSALSSTDEPPSQNSQLSGSSSSSSTSSQQSANRSPLFIPTGAGIHHQQHSISGGGGQASSEQVRVWRDPNLLLESEPHVRHIHSVQHQSLLMSHPSAPAATGLPQTSSAATGHPASLYPPAPSAIGMPPHPSMHILPNIYQDLWKHQVNNRYGSLAVPGAHLMHNPVEEYDRAVMDRERMRRERQSQEIEKQKENERLERERQEREKHEKQEKERQNQALRDHFDKSLRKIDQQKREQQWNPIAGRPPQPRTSSLSEDDRKRVEQDLHQRHLPIRADHRDQRYYSAVQRPPSVPGKTEYPPPPAHSRLSSSKSSSDKIHPSMQQQKSELNMYHAYPVMQPQNPFFEPKNKAEISKSGYVVNKSGSHDRERELGNPPPLVSEMKSSVIVKHDGKNPHQVDSRVPMAHSPSPKLRNEMMAGHYMPPSGHAPKNTMYEYRSPTQSPHHLSLTPSPHHHEPQNLGKSSGHHRSSGQLPSPHHRQSPHLLQQQPHPGAEVRYRSNSESQAMIFPTSAKNNYYLQSTTAAYTMASANAVNSKPKVSSPAPHHIYGKPSSGVVSVPVSRGHDSSSNPMQLTSKPPSLSSSVSPSPYQQVPQYHPPHPRTPPIMNLPPPPAHSSKTERMFSSVPMKMGGQQGSSPPTATSAPMPVRTHPQYMAAVPMQNISSVQTQPLDLGVSSSKYESSVSPKRKASTPVSTGSVSPGAMDAKKRKVETPPSAGLQQNLTVFSPTARLARVSEPSPLIASAATTITTVVNTATAYRTPTPTSITQAPSPTLIAENLPDVSVTTVNVPVEAARPASTESSHSQQRPPSVPQSTSPTPVPGTQTAEESPNTPVKTPVPPPSLDSEKSNSPGPNKTSSGGTYPVRHLKKAWLQRHTGEDVEDTTGVVGSGSCVTLPINIKPSTTPPATPVPPTPAVVPVTKENPVNSIHSVGSMAVNSISKTKHFNKGANRKTPKEGPSVNGHPAESANKPADDSSSSDQEKDRKSPPKRKPPKVKRKKGGGAAAAAAAKKAVEEKKRKTGNQSASVASESGSESDKESGSEKDSDSGASTTVANNGGNKDKKTNSSESSKKEPRKRGRRPKGSKNDKGEEPRPKKSKEDSLPPRDPFRKPPVGQLKKTGETFLQDGPCFEVAPKLAKCRECRWTPNQRSKNMPNIFCRFYAFRRLRYTKNGQLAIAGFSDPHKDALGDDIKLWLPNSECPPSDLDLETSRFLLKQVGDHFCDLLVQEKEAHNEHMSDDKTIAWKRVVQGVREMCDVCETTLFNFHWACGKCGFVVCLDCYKSRKSGTIKIWGEPGKDKDEFSWLLCTNRSAHEQEKLMLTQIIAGDSLLKLGKKVHEVRDLWNIEQYCGCQASKDGCQKSNNVAYKEIIKECMEKMNGVKKEIKEEDSKVNGVKEEKSSPLPWLADIALANEDKKSSDSSSDEEGNYSTLRELLIRPSHKPNGSRAASPVTKEAKNKKSNSKGDALDDVISSVIEDSVPKTTAETSSTEPKSELKHFVRRYNWQSKGRAPIPIRIMTLTESKTLYPDVPHSWLCDGKLLRLSDSTHKENYKIFQDQWKRGQPVIVSDVTKKLDRTLWNPDAFARDFGEEKNDLINCMTGNLVPNQPMRKFWEGFDHFQKRLKDDKGNPMLLKLKDWPPGEDFAEMLPTRFNDLMKVLPLPDYTHRTGRLNLASRLPDCFVRPDLGPKMYNAYGSALHPNKGTTNLHLDISDAVNVMVYVGIPKDGDSDEHIKEAFRAIDEAGCDILTRRRVRDKGELPGALWHIYNARDADKIRDLLNKVVVEQGGRLEPHHDPIHDQSCYLDGPLRERLYKEYGVEGYAIVQCLGDAVFIPAGAPHQVRNLHNCIKIAEDFVSPENVSHCFHLTQEFRDLTDTHSNHEDKLQIKNIIYHAVKDSLSSLSAIVNKHLKVKCEKDDSESDSANNSNVDSSEPA